MVVIEGVVECWSCHKETRVYTWPGHKLWQKEKPDVDLPDTVYKQTTTVVDESYWANHCEFCGAVQGDYYVFAEGLAEWGDGWMEA